MLERLDVESERGRDGVDVLAVELLQDRRLPRVVQTSGGSRRQGLLYLDYGRQPCDIAPCELLLCKLSTTKCLVTLIKIKG